MVELSRKTTSTMHLNGSYNVHDGTLVWSLVGLQCRRVLILQPTRG